MFTGKLGESLWIITTDGNDSQSLILQFGQFGLQLDQLLLAIGSRIASGKEECKGAFFKMLIQSMGLPQRIFQDPRRCFLTYFQSV